MKQVKKVVIYYTDGTYQEVDAAIPATVVPSGPVKRSPAQPAEIVPFTIPDDPFKLPGESGKWPFYPGGQPSIVD